MNNHPVTINGVKYSRLVNAMKALGIPASEYDHLYYALSKKTAFSHSGMTIYFRGDEIFSRRSRLRKIRDELPEIRERAERRFGDRKPLMRGICTSFLGVDHGEHWL